MIVLDLASCREDLEKLETEELTGALDDPSVAPEASRTRILALEESGVDTNALLELARGSVLRVAEDVFPG
jgi:hypothetical protein